MKLLLDEMFAATLAEALRGRGHDVVAVLESTTLRHRPDEEILEAATRDDRALATEDAVDLVALDAAWRATNRAHAGLVLTSNRQFPRHDRRYVGRLVAALHAFLSDPPQEKAFVRWL